MTETKKEAFRKYLESAGVIDAVTKVLVGLYEEPDRPKNAIDYMKSSMGAPTPEEHEKLKAEKEAVEKELEEAKEQIAQLQEKLTSLEAGEEGEEEEA